MSTGGNIVKIGGAYVDIDADLTNFDNAVAALPRKAGDRMAEVKRVLEATAKKTQLEIGVAYRAGDLATQQRLIPIYDQLRGKIDAVTAAATRQAQAMQDAARAQVAAAQQATAAQAAAAQKAAIGPLGSKGWADLLVQRTPTTDQGKAAEALRAGIAGVTAAPADAATAKLAALGKAGAKAGDEVKKGGMSGAMGLLILSQTIDDAQYGFRSIVNNIPTLGMAFAGLIGKSAQFGLALGGALGIAGVAVNLLLTHWDKLMDAMGLGKIRTEAEEMEELGKKANKTAEEIDRLNKFTREQKAIERIRGTEPEARREHREAVEKAIGESGFEEVRGALAAQMRGSMVPEESKELRRAQRNAAAMERDYGAGSETAQAAARRRDELQGKIDERLNKKALEDAERLMAKAALEGPEGPNKAAIMAKVQRAPGAFPAGFEGRLGDPDIVKRETEAERAWLKADEERREVNRQLNEQGRENEQAMLDERRQRREREAGRLAGAMDRSVGAGLLREPGMGQAALEAKIHESLQRSGLERPGVATEDMDKLARDIAVKLKEKMEHAVEGRAAERGISTEEARVQLLKEEREKDIADRKRAGGTNEIFSNESYASRLLMATQGGQREDRTPQEQLKVQQDAVKRLDELVKLNRQGPRGEGIARFARGPAA